MKRLSTRAYVNRPIDRTEFRVARAMRFARYAADNCSAPVLITLKNKRNPNGIYVRAEPGQTVAVTRFICLAWARKNGYDR